MIQADEEKWEILLSQFNSKTPQEKKNPSSSCIAPGLYAEPNCVLCATTAGILSEWGHRSPAACCSLPVQL